jgi:hypothetical protein
MSLLTYVINPVCYSKVQYGGVFSPLMECCHIEKGKRERTGSNQPTVDEKKMNYV